MEVPPLYKGEYWRKELLTSSVYGEERNQEENGSIDQTPTPHAVWCGRPTEILEKGGTEPIPMINPRFQSLKDAYIESGWRRRREDRSRVQKERKRRREALAKLLENFKKALCSHVLPSIFIRSYIFPPLQIL